VRLRWRAHTRDVSQDLSAFELRAVPTTDLTQAERDIMHALFDSNYRQANHPYLDKSFAVLRYAALAKAHDGTPAGFALGDMRIVDLPRLPATAVALAGICCVAPAYRRRGLFGALEMTAIGGAGIRPQGRSLAVGRMAHPASMRTMSRNPGVVPRPGVPITRWQREVGNAIAEMYGVERFHDDTFLVEGSGAPIGYPVMEVDVEPEEWVVFETVDRDRGDSLLGLSWRPDAPPGWES
jgi:GNAT superfamily N-acetyltransferase